MAILKYTNANGEVVKVNSYKVNNLVPQQTKGDNPNLVMSQKAVTDVANEIGLQIDEVTGKITAVKATADKAASDLTALTQTVNGKANAKDVYTKTEADGKYLTAADITGKAEKSEVSAVDAKADQNAADIVEINNTLGDCATNDALGELENIVTLKANKSALEAETTRATSAEEELADRVEALEDIRIITCGTY
ncbi:MAG: hypothetical protein HDT42_11520 [Ruminococcaceae bacterium]|nr:hypothetical protein [Oscillospiraceae bacterium]